MRAPIGIRISARRKAIGLSQADLARAVEISPSYLNLIEANKRQVGGALLARIANRLSVEIGTLSGEAEHRLIHELEESFADPVLENSRLDSDAARRMVAETPDIAAAIARLYRGYAAASARAEAHGDRLRSDPILSALLHQILSGITAIRASADILEGFPDLDEADRARFLATITRQSQGLTQVAQSLITQFDRSSTEARSASPRRELDDLIFASDNHFSSLEQAAAALRAEIEAGDRFGETALVEALSRLGITVSRTAPADTSRPYGFHPQTGQLWFRNTTTQATRRFQMARLYGELRAPEVIAAAAAGPLLSSEAARQLAHRALGAYLAGALVLPYERFLEAAVALDYDVEALSERFAASYEQVAHRLVTLRRPGAEGVPFGFLRADPSGRLSKHFPLPGLLLPNTGHACPLWALYTAFRTPGQISRQLVRFTDGSRYMFVAKAVSRRSGGFADPAPPYSILLACDVLHADRTVYGRGLDLADAATDVPVGPTCRLCTRHDCASRQEEAFVPGADATV